MGAARPPADAKQECTPQVLGDVIYANKGTPRVPESDWVKLVQAVAAGDQRALHALYARLHRPVFTLIVRITGSREAAEELTLDVFHDVWRRASAYRPRGGTVVGWIMNQARSRAIDRLRYEKRKKRVPGRGSGSPAAAAADGGPDQALELREQARLLQEALQALTRPEREAIETAFFSELTYVEAAARLKEPVGTVKTRIRSALGKLRRALAGGREAR